MPNGWSDPVCQPEVDGLETGRHFTETRKSPFQKKINFMLSTFTAHFERARPISKLFD